jgi:hypothetical protein
MVHFCAGHNNSYFLENVQTDFGAHITLNDV